MADSNHGGSSNLCTTPACIHVASDILWSLAPNYTEIDPCTNFNELVCGNWAARNDITPGQGYAVTLTKLLDQTYTTLKQLLEGPYSTGSDAGWITVDLTKEQAEVDEKNFDKLKKAYSVCTNYTSIENQGLKPLATFVKSVVDTFPVNAKSGYTSDAMGKTLTLFESLGIETFQRIAQLQNDYDPDEINIFINPPTKSDIPTTEEAQAEWIELAATLISAVHPANVTVKQAAKLMASSAVLQQTLAEAVAAAAAEEAQEVSRFYTLDEVKSIAKGLNYEYVIDQLAPKGYVPERILFPSTSYFGNLSLAISETPVEVIETFFIWKAISTLSPYIESEETNAYNEFLKKSQGADPESPAPRWRECASFVDSGVSWIARDETARNLIGPSGLTWLGARFFVDKNFSPEAKNLTSEILKTLKEAFTERLESRDWVSEETKKVAVDKVRRMAVKIGLPTDPDAVDPIKLQKYYAGANITSTHAFNALTLAKSAVAKKWASLGVPASKGEFLMSTLEPNAYHNPGRNEVVMLAGIQQSPVYDVDFPSYLLFGGMGSIVGHEITHGFDNRGRQYDATGNMTKWWDDSTIEAFDNRTECFVEQYSKFTITAPNGTQVPVNGELTLGENIADAGGVVSSFIAWKKWISEKGRAQDLPGLDKFTHEQLFFLKWGQSWCENTPARTALALVKTDPHSPNPARVNLALKNSAEFNKAFNCPTKKPVCELW
ncbi:hypothetical protein QQX98_002432 [Neonectria punicea]|uniref:Endothelin-converting enzyme 1 n=1 Tax=Neonectria punicea TaxID=979145 RepID=A0ABR1HIW4_9HYPO